MQKREGVNVVGLPKFDRILRESARISLGFCHLLFQSFETLAGIVMPEFRCAAEALRSFRKIFRDASMPLIDYAVNTLYSACLSPRSAAR